MGGILLTPSLIKKQELLMLARRGGCWVVFGFHTVFLSVLKAWLPSGLFFVSLHGGHRVTSLDIAVLWNSLCLVGTKTSSLLWIVSQYPTDSFPDSFVLFHLLPIYRRSNCQKENPQAVIPQESPVMVVKAQAGGLGPTWCCMSDLSVWLCDLESII